MLKVGIDQLAIYTSSYALNLTDLAKAREIDPEKYTHGLGQYAMSVPPPGEDIVTLGANAALSALQGIDRSTIEMVLFATESSIDQSKAAGIYLHELLALPARCRVVELKQACYASTAAIQLALPYLRENPHKKILVIASDIARYGLGTSGESSQGAGAVAILLSAHPRILAIEAEFGVVTESIMDFWRPNYRHEALVDGKYSSKMYLQMLEKAWEQYTEISKRTLRDHAHFCYHAPVPRLVEKAHQHLLKLNDTAIDGLSGMDAALHYNRQMGNSYTASLYVSLASLLEQNTQDLTGQRIGFYSYGSGCVAEFFSGIVQEGYQNALGTANHARLLAERTLLSYDDYVKFYQFHYTEDGSEQIIPVYKTGQFRLAKLKNHQRIYERQAMATPLFSFSSSKESVVTKQRTVCNTIELPAAGTMKIAAPGKLILSGEHAVVHGSPALAMAINRYVTAVITQEASAQINFDLADLAHHSRLSLSTLKNIKDRIKRKYHRFINGEFSIREVLQKPFELAQFAFGLFADTLNVSLPHGMKIAVSSDIPIGCGMGSSAATILSVMQAVSHYLQLSIPPETLLKLALEAENMQHGHSSGLDLHVTWLGGCLYVDGHKTEARPLPHMPMYLINTGTPQATTGQCVEKVRPYFKKQSLRDEFTQVTRRMDQALTQKNWPNMQAAIRRNHQLLVDIGVVPNRVQQLITQIENMQGSAKICGAGSIYGDEAGAVLAIVENQQVLAQLCDDYAYQLMPISGELRGVHAA